MPTVTTIAKTGGSMSTPVRLSDIIHHFKKLGNSEHPTRPRSPVDLWLVDIAVAKHKRTFPTSGKPIRITLKIRGISSND